MLKSPAPTHEQIQQRAYELFLERGCDPGTDVEDWLVAEKELTLEPALAESRIEEVRESEVKEPRLSLRTRIVAAGAVTPVA